MDDCYGFMCNLFSSLFALFIVGALVILAWKFLEFHVFGGKEDFSAETGRPTSRPRDPR